MAFPLGLAIAALVAGTGAQMAGQRKVRKAESRAYQHLSDARRKRSAEASALFEKALGGQDVGTQQDAIDAAAADKVARVDDLVGTNDAYVDPLVPGQDRAPAVIKAAMSSQLADELARARAEIAAQATLEGYSTRTFDRGLQLNRVKPELANIGLFAQGDQNIFDAEMLGAQGKGQTWATIGDILTGIGQVGLMASGGFGGFGASGESVVGAADAALANAPKAMPKFSALTRGYPF